MENNGFYKVELNLCACVCGVCVALVVPAAKLEQPGCDSPGVHGFPHLRRGQSSAAEVHSQARQVGQKTLASSRQHNSLTVDSSEGVSRPCSRVRETQGQKLGNKGSMALLPNLNALIVARNLMSVF